jgi:heme-degrading monooxygenase HmoA
MAETYTSGVWIVNEGEEDDFVAAWSDFVAWAREQEGAGTLRLVRDVRDASRYMSFAQWESFEAQQGWKATDEFRRRMTRVQQHVADFTPSVWELVVQVD